MRQTTIDESIEVGFIGDQNQGLNVLENGTKTIYTKSGDQSISL